MKKNYLLRVCEDTYSLVEKIAKEEDRSVNYMLCKLIDKGLENSKSNNQNAIYLKKQTIKDIEKIASKCNKTKEEVLELIVETYKSTFK